MEFRAVLFFRIQSTHKQSEREKKKTRRTQKISQTSTADKDQQNKFDMVVNFSFFYFAFNALWAFVYSTSSSFSRV